MNKKKKEADAHIVIFTIGLVHKNMSLNNIISTNFTVFNLSSTQGLDPEKTFDIIVIGSAVR